MLHTILGFGGRLGRLEYFIISLVFGIFVGLIILALFLGVIPHGATKAEARASLESPGLLLILLLVIVPIYLWFSLALQAKRLRDIGWNPLYIIPGWITVVVIDRFVAMAVPVVALGPGSGTLVGLLINLFMTGSLLFWPSAPTGTADWGGSTHPMGSPAPQPYSPRETSPVPRPAAATWNPTPAQTPSGFGRRGL